MKITLIPVSVDLTLYSGRLILLTLLLTGFAGDSWGKQRTPSRPSSPPGTVSNISWDPEGEFVDFTTEGKRFRYQLSSGKKTESPHIKQSEAQPDREERRRNQKTEDIANTGKYLGRPTRGRQYTEVQSPDGQWEARHRDWNVWLMNLQTGVETAVTTEGNENIKYGTASWVYGEELRQTQSMWWTPDSRKLLFYKFDDTEVKPFYLLRGLSELNTELYPEYYPKAGAANPVSSLLIYDLETAKTISVPIGGSAEEYLYNIRVTPGGHKILVNWTDRLQQHLKVYSIDLDSGECSVVVEEQQSTWQTNSPPMTYLRDGQRFLWPTDRSGFTHYELRDIQGNLLQQVTSGDFQINSIELYESDELLGFSAHSCAANPYYNQYHLVELNGQDQRRVTTLDYHHSNFSLSPNREWLIAQYEDVNRPPCTALYRTDGTYVTDLASGDVESPANLAEVFSFPSKDGSFEIYGILYKPADFDPTKKYPVINALYGGPGSVEYRPTYVSQPRPETSRGYLVVKVNNRGTGGRGKAFLGSTYRRLGDVDIQDHADAIRYLSDRPYIDSDRIGIVGHSYGGYLAAMGIFKHPDVYHCAVIRAGVTDWRHYDTIYTERYMSTPQLNPDGYRTGAAITYAADLKGKILIMHGMLDDNVHPNNAFQLIEALDQNNKRYESRFWANAGHGLGRGAGETETEFFDRVLQPQAERD